MLASFIISCSPAAIGHVRPVPSSIPSGSQISSVVESNEMPKALIKISIKAPDLIASVVENEMDTVRGEPEIGGSGLREREERVIAGFGGIEQGVYVMDDDASGEEREEGRGEDWQWKRLRIPAEAVASRREVRFKTCIFMCGVRV